MGDVARGKALFMKMCAVCHTTEKGGKHKIGPNLHGIVGRTSGTIEGYAFSQGMTNKAVVWDDTNLNQYLETPRTFIPGSKMVFAGLKRASERQDIVAFLQTLK